MALEGEPALRMDLLFIDVIDDGLPVHFDHDAVPPDDDLLGPPLVVARRRFEKLDRRRPFSVGGDDVETAGAVGSNLSGLFFWVALYIWRN